MPTFRTQGGLLFRARDAWGIVRQMKRAQWNAPDRKPEYMMEAAARASMMTGRAIRHADPDAFLHDLVQAGLLTAVPEASVS